MKSMLVCLLALALLTTCYGFAITIKCYKNPDGTNHCDKKLTTTVTLPPYLPITWSRKPPTLDLHLIQPQCITRRVHQVQREDYHGSKSNIDL
ncbi:hypothetical protein TNIN_398361 [Trichonephila inaurata madagascariensis]|uniref:Uncharacterized protein n=1 Tax=Trichonephila inaurata madagascariensis TaxID=2747483 RepID=A0A8X6XSJ6_9ARAC|nr:hypothetical protein TNIN_398361 [Trichonephila inaurata madagascariensis]